MAICGRSLTVWQWLSRPIIQIRFKATAYFVAIKYCNELPDIITDANISIYILICLIVDISFFQMKVRYISQHIRQSQAGGIPLLNMLYISLISM